MPPSNPVDISDIKFNYGRFIEASTFVGVIAQPRPTVVTWSRLEPLPYNESLTEALQAQMADPLWLMGRQWQFGEFQGEDAGTPVWSKLNGDLGQLSLYEPSRGPAVNYSDLQRPLEVVVEQEEIRSQHPRLSAEAGEHFLRLLAVEGASGGSTRARSLLRKAFTLNIEESDVAFPQADPAGKAWKSLFRNRAIDGFKLAKTLRTNVLANGTISTLPEIFNAMGELGAPAIVTTANRWLIWYDQHLCEPTPPGTPKTVDTGSSDAWQPERLEYGFKLSAQLDNSQVVLSADEYTDGDLDWYSFKALPGATLKSTSIEPDSDKSPTDFTPLPTLPTPVRYPGMPADRYWEFEDARVNLGYLDAGPTDLVRMLLAEYGLVYSNDWFLMPVELPVGSLFRVNSLQVHDTFGETTEVKPARNFDGTRWTMFSLTDAQRLPKKLQDLFFLPPVLPSRLEGDPIEDITLFRDEMANMAWAVEHKVPSAAGVSMDRRMEPPSGSVHQQVDIDDIEADFIYRLATPVADNWLPFVPVAANKTQPFFKSSIGLERRTLVKTLPDGEQMEIHPKGILLRSNLSIPVKDEPPLKLFEEEVPREGARVQRGFQYARWVDGSCCLWVGRKKSAGRGEGSSGLRFDIATFTAQKSAPISQQPVRSRTRARFKKDLF